MLLSPPPQEAYTSAKMTTAKGISRFGERIGKISVNLVATGSTDKRRNRKSTECQGRSFGTSSGFQLRPPGFLGRDPPTRIRLNSFLAFLRTLCFVHYREIPVAS